MEIDRKELKRRARADMGAAKPPFWAVLLAYLLLTTGVSDLLYLVPLPGGDGIPPRPSSCPCSSPSICG